MSRSSEENFTYSDCLFVVQSIFMSSCGVVDNISMNVLHTTSRRVVVLAVVAVLLLLGPSIVAAQSIEGTSGTVVVEPDETVDSINSVAGSIVIHGTVTGDVSGVSGYVHVAESGQVNGSVETAAGTVRIDGTVAGNIETGSGHVEINDGAQVGGMVDVGAGYLLVDGQVNGAVRATAETITLGPNAVVDGEFRYDADTFNRDSAATVGGGVVQDATIAGDSTGPIADLTVPGWLGIVYSLLANLLLGAILLAVFPSFTSTVASRVTTDPVMAGAVGFLSFIGIPILLILVAITIIGIPLAVLGAFGFAGVLWIAAVLGQYAVGNWALKFIDRDNRWLALAVGLFGFAILGSIPVVGGFFELIALLLGLGALVGGLRDVYRTRGKKQSEQGPTVRDDAQTM
jgi:cytoskeletal protein CcmA (bactofilin family)